MAYVTVSVRTTKSSGAHVQKGIALLDRYCRRQLRLRWLEPTSYATRILTDKVPFASPAAISSLFAQSRVQKAASSCSMRTMGSEVFTSTESESVDGAGIQTAAYRRWDPVVQAPSQAGTGPRRLIGSRLRTRQRANQVSSVSWETAPTAFLNHFVMTLGADCIVNRTYWIMRGQGTPFELKGWPTVYTQHQLASHFSLVVVGYFRTRGRAKAP
jgi:hypothetical protein